MTNSTDGIILKTQKIRESDRLVTVLTRQNGLVHAFCSGALNVKSKKHAGTQLLAYSMVTLSKSKDTWRITEAEPKETFTGIRDDLISLSLAEYFCELTAYFAPEEEDGSNYLRLILNSLYLLSTKKCNPLIVKTVTELKLLCLSGYTPSLNECAICGTQFNSGFCFDLVNGISFCDSHTEISGGIFLSNSIAAAMKYIVSSPLEKAYSFSLPDRVLKQFSNLTERYVVAQAEKSFKTLDFYNSIK